MLALPQYSTRILPRAHAVSGSRLAFTLTELLVVIALIVLLVSLLLAALNQVQAKSRETSTIATMQSFSNSCDAFQQEHSFYPGLVPEAILANDPKISGTENALLHLLGGGIAEEGSSPVVYANYGGTEYTFDKPNGDTYNVKVDRNVMGDGPTIGGKPYAAYYTPSAKDFGEAKGQNGSNDPNTPNLPDLLDAWGQPIVYLRRQRSIGPLADFAGNSANPQFDLMPMTPYTQAVAPLGRLGREQLPNSLWNQTSAPEATLMRLLEHPSIPGQSRGAYLMMSAGPDGIFLGHEDGAGSAGDPIDDLVEGDGTWIDPYGPQIFEEYDDVLLFGGG